MIEAVLIGASAGGMKALTAILPALPKHFGMAVIVAQHLHAGSDGYLAEHLNRMCEVRVKDADEKEAVEPGTVYIAPARYHLLVEEDRTLSLSGEPHVNYARPSIDVLFESAVEVFEDRIVGSGRQVGQHCSSARSHKSVRCGNRNRGSHSDSHVPIARQNLRCNWNTKKI